MLENSFWITYITPAHLRGFNWISITSENTTAKSSTAQTLGALHLCSLCLALGIVTLGPCLVALKHPLSLLAP